MMAAGEMSPAEFTTFLKAAFANLANAAADGAIHFIAMDWRHMAEVLEAGHAAFGELKNLCVWSKTSAGVIAERCCASTARHWLRLTRPVMPEACFQA